MAVEYLHPHRCRHPHRERGLLLDLLVFASIEIAVSLRLGRLCPIWRVPTRSPPRSGVAAALNLGRDGGERAGGGERGTEGDGEGGQEGKRQGERRQGRGVDSDDDGDGFLSPHLSDARERRQARGCAEPSDKNERAGVAPWQKGQIHHNQCL